MTIKKKVESVFRNFPPLFRLGSRVYHKMNPGFKSLSPGAPDAIKNAFKLARELNPGKPIGDYYEFGLYKGYSFFSAYMVAKKLGLSDTRFFGFDSFRGLPPVEDIDKTGKQFFEGQFAYNKKNVEKNLRKHGMDFDKVQLIEGFFEDTLDEELKRNLKAGHAGVVMLDCDLYSSTSTALDWLDGLIADKTVVIFDDWYSFTEGDELGQQRALKEFQLKNNHLVFKPHIEYERSGKVFLVREREE
jgi:hypothetical protein